MKVKIFQGIGRDEIDDLEGIINEWLRALPDTTKVLATESSAAGGLSEGGGEASQTLIVCVWYEEN